MCGAARGPLRIGDDGMNHLGGTFLRAGADVVLLSGADIDQLSTERLLDAFYARMAIEGLSPARALLAARRELAADPLSADPFDHALLQLNGLGFRPLPGLRAEARSTRPWATWSVTVLVALALTFAWTRRRR